MDTKHCGEKKLCRSKQSQCGKCEAETKPTTSENLTELAAKLDEKVKSCSNRILNSINLLNKNDS